MMRPRYAAWRQKGGGFLEDHAKFREYLHRVGRVAEQKIDHYLRWVNRYLALHGTGSPDGSSVKSYLAYLARDHEEWKVRQAQDALAHYREYLHSRKTATLEEKRAVTVQFPRSESEAGQKPVQIGTGRIGWEQTEVKLRDCIRLRGLAWQTEKSYLGWFVRFREFLRDKEVRSVTEEDLKRLSSSLR
jgi:hypothetical protein